MPLTTYGRTALTSAITGGYLPPLYLVIDTMYTTLALNVTAGDGVFSTTARVDQAGDTQLIVGLGLIGQETITFTGAPTGSGPYVYTLTGTFASNHTTGDPVSRNPLASDTMANIVGEVEFDHAFSPGLRAAVPAGFSPGTGQWTTSAYLTFSQALYYITAWGLSDSITIGAGNLHAYMPLGFDHSSGLRDLELDGTLTLT